MWKESYRLGVETIDSQHRRLFKMVDDLIEVVSGGEREDYRQKCADAVNFLYGYTVEHFRFEEGYQASIGYKDMEAHKLQHKRFIVTVDNFAKRMLDSEYDIRVVKAFCGSLIAWLNFHVADTDQKIAGKKLSEGHESLITCLGSFLSGALDAVKAMLGLSAGEITKTMSPNRKFRGDISYELGLIGDISGKALFEYSNDYAYSTVNSLITLLTKDAEEIDEIARSAMAETSNIIAGKAATVISDSGKACDISPPVLVSNRREAWPLEGFHLRTPKGDMQVLLYVD
ncbi:MAG: bacteriohemerythrin [Synergistaceae bacterium]|jgi:hemerythrin-like metal-binding protein|nr:bacteriohemerythrin [Synergistaceae bacterium]